MKIMIEASNSWRSGRKRFRSWVHMSTFVTSGSRFSRMDQVKFGEDRMSSTNFTCSIDNTEFVHTCFNQLYPLSHSKPRVFCSSSSNFHYKSFVLLDLSWKWIQLKELMVSECASVLVQKDSEARQMVGTPQFWFDWWAKMKNRISKTTNNMSLVPSVSLYERRKSCVFFQKVKKNGLQHSKNNWDFANDYPLIGTLYWCWNSRTLNKYLLKPTVLRSISASIYCSQISALQK